jgi:predicted metal-dependent HD superfamily phosphohydrolase
MLTSLTRWHQRRPRQGHRASSTRSVTAAIMAAVDEELNDRWAVDLGRGRDATTTLDRLLTRYRESHRHYHTLPHVLRVLRTLDELVANVPVPDAGAVRLAAWYHDAVYEPAATGNANEVASAALARRDLVALGQPRARVDAIERLVLMTASHRPTDADDEAVLCDADLAILAADAATYTAYANGVRAEYGHLSEAEWRSGRAAVLRTLLAERVLFHTPKMHAREATARANLAAELASLD